MREHGSVKLLWVYKRDHVSINLGGGCTRDHVSLKLGGRIYSRPCVSQGGWGDIRENMGLSR